MKTTMRRYGKRILYAAAMLLMTQAAPAAAGYNGNDWIQKGVEAVNSLARGNTTGAVTRLVPVPRADLGTGTHIYAGAQASGLRQNLRAITGPLPAGLNAAYGLQSGVANPARFRQNMTVSAGYRNVRSSVSYTPDNQSGQ